MSGNSYLRIRARRWTSSDVVAATMRLEQAFTKDKTARAIAAVHKATLVRGHRLLPVERDEVQVVPLIESVERQTLATLKAPDVQEEYPGQFGGFSFRLPWAPSVNHAYFNKKGGGGRAKTTKARLFVDLVGIELATQRVPLRKLSHPMAITITQHTNTSAGDVDNGIKLALDALKYHGVIADDNRKIVKRVTVQDGARVKANDQHIEINIECLGSGSICI